MLIDEYKRRYERPADQELRPIAPLGRERDRQPRGPLLPPWAVIAGVLVIVVVALYVLGNTGSQKSTPPTTTTQAVVHHKHHHRRHHPAAPPPPTTAKLQLTATGPVYVCLVNGSGTKLIPGVIYSPGQTIPTETAPKLLLTLGNASVQMKVNGTAVTVASSSSAIGYSITSSGAKSVPVSQTDCG
jgi:hypothetical protein